MNASSNETNTTWSSNGGGNQLNQFAIRIAQIPIFILTIIFAISYTILIFANVTFRQNKLNWFTANICMTSAVFCTIMLSLNIQILTSVYSGISCRLQTFLIYTSVCQIMYSHCVAAICRFFAVVYANKHLFRSMKFSLISIIVGWFVAQSTALPFLFVDGFVCGIVTKNIALSFYTMMTIFVIPIILIGISNVKILLFVRRSSRQVQEGNSQSRASHARDIHLLKVLIGTYLVFAVGWAPAFGIQAFGDNASIPSLLDGITQMLPPITMFLDVILLIVTNQPVRIFLKELFLKRFRQRIQPMMNVGKTR